MSIKSRLSLKSQFIQGAIPSEQDFCDLIDSAVNKKDDRFFGRWQAGVSYPHNSVVIYDKSLYILDLTIDPNCEDEDTSTEPDEGDDVECDEPQSGDATAEELCSSTPPNQHCQWCLMQLETTDDDFEIIEDPDGLVIGVARVQGRVGIGTRNPNAKLDVTDEESGHLLLEPNVNGCPEITLVKIAGEEGADSEERQASIRLGGARAELRTDTLGYVFFQLPEESGGVATRDMTADTTVNPYPLLALAVDPDDANRIKAGIGTEKAQGNLEVREENRGALIVNPSGHAEPEFLLVNLESSNEGEYLLAAVNTDASMFITDAKGGFQFKKGSSCEEILSESSPATSETLMTIHSSGNVGIGTESPESHLHITDNESGTFKVHLDNDNPVASLINERPNPNQPNTYLAVGVDDDFATFSTDTAGGYVFKKGGKTGKFDNEVNINQGDGIVFIHPEGRLGIQTTEAPENYQLDVNGKGKVMGLYLETDGSKINQTGDLEADDVINRLAKLKPIRYEWKDHTNCSGDGEQIGFHAQNIFECLPEAVQKEGTVKAYNLEGVVAFLTQVVKCQQEEIDTQRKRIDELYSMVNSLKKKK
ncbi:MAG: tail fiber domain-containing protein [Bacteroidota bacterium]